MIQHIYTHRFKSWIGRSILVCFGVVISLMLSEVVLRCSGLAPRVIAISNGRYRLSADPKLGYEPTPGLAYEGQNLLGYDYRTPETNSLGFRSKEYPVTRKAGTLRIAVLGDSLAVGLWVERYEETFPSLLERELLLRISLVATPEVINFGVVGYNTMQEVAMFRNKALAFKPDLVLVEYCLNDRERNDGALLASLTASAKSEKGPLTILESPIFIKSALYRFIKYRVMSPAGPKYEAGVFDNRYDILASDSVDNSLRELGSLHRESGIPVLLAIFPRFGDLNNYAWNLEHERVTKIASEGGIWTLDLLEAFKKCQSKLNQGLSFDEYHPNPLGHRCAAEAMAQFIQSKLDRGELKHIME